MAMVGRESNSEGKGGRIFSGRFDWEKDELEGLSLPTSRGRLVIIAADVVYDEGLTDAFFDVLKLLMPVPTLPSRNKSASKGAGCAGLVEETSPASSASEEDVGFFGSLASVGEKSIAKEKGTPGVRRQAAVLYLAIEKRFNFSIAELSVAATGYNALLRNVLDVTTEGRRAEVTKESCRWQGLKTQKKSFEGRRLPISFQQCFQYQRSNAMEFWEIQRRPSCN